MSIPPTIRAPRTPQGDSPGMIDGRDFGAGGPDRHRYLHALNAIGTILLLVTSLVARAGTTPQHLVALESPDKGCIACPRPLDAAAIATGTIEQGGRPTHPRTLPRWMSGMRVGEWRQIAGTAAATLGEAPFAGTVGDVKNHLAYSGAALKREGSWLVQFGGGHADYSGNDVIAISLEEDAPTWRVLRRPTVPADPGYWSNRARPEYKGVWWDAHHLPDGRPASRHSGWALQFIDRIGRLLSFYDTSAFGTSSTSTTHVDAFRWADKDWDPAGTWPGLPHMYATSYPWTVKDPDSEDVYIGVGASIYRWNPSNGKFTSIRQGLTWAIDHGLAGLDKARNRLLIIGIWNQTPRITAQVVGLNDGQQAFVTLAGPFADKMRTSAQVDEGGFDWCPDLGKFVFFPDDGQTYTVDPATLIVDRLPVTGAVPPANSRYSYQNGSGIFGRFRYVPALHGIVYLADWRAPLWFLKTGE